MPRVYRKVVVAPACPLLLLKKNSMIRKLMFTILSILLLTGCDRKVASVPQPANSVYYWRTTLVLDSAEKQFLKDNKIGKIYLRYFDVVVKDGKPMPNATLRFADTIPAGIEVIPTVFIVENVLNEDMTGLAQNLVERVLQMCETNDVNKVDEMQIDCDWTELSQEKYYRLLSEINTLLATKGMRLSATIRLHQLRMTPPPVDYGVLMMYNTGDATNREEENPILDYATAEPYFAHLKKYDLPLCVAYPNFSWNLLFDGTEFSAILYNVDLCDKSMFKKISDNHYVVISSRSLPQTLGDDNTHAHAGNEVLVKTVPFALLNKVHDELAKRRKDINTQVIVYHLDANNINNYNAKEYEKIFSP